MKIIDYTILDYRTGDKLAYEVNLKIVDGWQPLGPVQAYGTNETGIYFQQTMVKYEKPGLDSETLAMLDLRDCVAANMGNFCVTHKRDVFECMRIVKRFLQAL